MSTLGIACLILAGLLALEINTFGLGSRTRDACS